MGLVHRIVLKAVILSQRPGLPQILLASSLKLIAGAVFSQWSGITPARYRPRLPPSGVTLSPEKTGEKAGEKAGEKEDERRRGRKVL